jgi:hypothetical protein
MGDAIGNMPRGERDPTKSIRRATLSTCPEPARNYLVDGRLRAIEARREWVRGGEPLQEGKLRLRVAGAEMATGRGRLCDAGSVSDEKDVCNREFGGVGQAEERARRAQCGHEPGRFTMKLELRGAVVSHDFDVAPRDATTEPGADRLHAGFLRCESRRVRGGRSALFALAVGDLAGGVDSLAEAIAVLRQQLRNARHFRRIQSD